MPKRPQWEQTEKVKPSARARRPKLTQAQLERKRECDRAAQRQIRMKTKNHIAHLEGLVKTLQDGNGESDRVNQLVEQVRSSHQEINRLREIIRGVNKLVEGTALPSDTGFDTESLIKMKDVSKTELPPSATDPLEKMCTDLESDENHCPGLTPRERFLLASPDAAASLAGLDDEFIQGDAVFETFPHEEVDPDDPPIAAPSVTSIDEEYERLSSAALTTQSSRSLDVVKKINAVAKQIAQDLALDGRLWYLAGCVLNLILNMPRTNLTPIEYEEDIPIRAVLHGWGTTASQYYLDPGWLWLRHLDEALYSALGIPERLSIMRIMRMQFRAQVRPQNTEDLPLPGFMAARPAQEYMQHEPLVEHFVWPGLRERIVFSPRKYATNRFMDNFRNHARFMWNYNPEDTYNRNSITGTYTFSTMFMERQGDLRCWSMRSGFFDAFPELRQDIASCDESPWNSQPLLTANSSNSLRKLLLANKPVEQQSEDELSQACSEKSSESLIDIYSQPDLEATGFVLQSTL